MQKKKSFFIILGALIVVIIAIICLIYLPLPKPTKIYKDNLRSIVEVKSYSKNAGESFGTAEFIDKEGRLVTNAHVVTYTQLGVTLPFDELYIRFANENEYRRVLLVKYDVSLDIAVIQLMDDNKLFQPIKLGDPASLESGDTVYAIGNTINYGLTISQGIVGIPLLEIKESENLRQVIQCDLTIAEGNSGGALLNERGYLIGLTTFRTKDNYGNVVYGIAYCIPIDIVMEYVYGSNP